MVFSDKKKENNLDVLTEDKIRQKLYGYLNENKQQKTKSVEEKTQTAQPILRPEIKKEAEVKIKNPEKEKPAAVKEEIKTSPRAAKPVKVNAVAIKAAIKKIEEKSFSAGRVCFAQIKKLKNLPHTFLKARIARSLPIIILILALGLFVLNIKKKPSSSSPGLNAASHAAVPVKKTEVTIPEKAPFYTIQVCVYEKEKDALRLVEELKQKKLDAYLSADNSKSRTKYQVYVGKFSSSDNAKATLGKLKSAFKDSFVRRMN